MIDDSRVYEILNEICDNVSPKRSKRGFVSRCPVCGDSKKSQKIRRLHTDYYAKHDDWAITCYNGGCPFHSGNIYSLYATVKGVSFTEAKKYIKEDTYNAKDIIKSLSGSKKPEVKETTKPHDLDIDLENDCIYLSQETTDRFQLRYKNRLMDFLYDRQIPDEYASRICVAYQGRYKGRVIIPIYLKDKLVYFQGRSLFSNIEPKYLNPEVDKEMIISNSDKFSRDKYIMVTEGLIDSWMIEDNQGTSVNGGYFNDDLIAKLFTMTDMGVILIPDNPVIDQAGRDMLVNFIKESKYAGMLKYFLMPYHDFKDLNELALGMKIDNMYDFVVQYSLGSFSTNMNLNLSSWKSLQFS